MDKARLEQNLKALEERIAVAAHKVGRNPADIKLVAVTKTVSTDVAADLHELGITDMGENRPQELKRKRSQLPGVHWHMIGRLQRNKVKDVVGQVDLIHSLDRWELALEIDKRAALNQIVQPVLLQVNVAGEEQKAGVEIAEIDHFLQEASELQHIQITGLMTMAPLDADDDSIRAVFRKLYQEFLRCKQQHAKIAEMKHLSMGMSNDFELAIQEGANIIRVGSLLFA